MADLLVLAAGRRRYVVEELLRTKPQDDILWVTDGDPLTPGLSVPGACAYAEPSLPAVEWLPEFCRARGINAVLSLHDYQAITVSALRGQLASQGTLWIGPSHDVALTLLDKRLLADHLSTRDPGLVIPTYVAGERLPGEADKWVVKDRLGSGSSGLRVGLDRPEAEQALRADDVVAQPMVLGEEWNLDFFVQRNGTVQGYSAKRKFRMRGGETDAAEVVLAGDVPFDVERVLDAFRGIDHLGNVDLDVFVNGQDVKVVDVNPRFGGGYAFSLHAGYPAAQAVWCLTRGEELNREIAPSSVFRGAKSIEVVPI